MLKLDRTSPELQAAEDPTAYSKPQIQRLLAALHAGARGLGVNVVDCWRAATPEGLYVPV